MIWTIPAISSKTCGSGTWTICSRCADKRAPVGTITQHQRSRLAERIHSILVTRQARRRSKLRPHLPKLRLVEPEVPEQPNKYGNTSCVQKTDDGYLKDARFLGRRPVLLVPLPSRVGGNLTATRRCDTTTSANPSDGRSGYCTPPASRKHPRNQHGKTTEERREGESTQQKDGPDAPPEGAGT